jgi:hypothetical protein
MKMNNQVIAIPPDFKDIEKQLSIMLDKNEDAIRNYISRYVYTSSISPEIHQQISSIFQKIKNDLL